jgi:hypothetical protein
VKKSLVFVLSIFLCPVLPAEGVKILTNHFKIQNNILEHNRLSNVIFYFKGQSCSGLLDKADRRSKGAMIILTKSSNCIQKEYIILPMIYSFL